MIEIEGTKYQVLSTLTNHDREFADRIKELYEGRDNIVLIQKKQSVGWSTDERELLICRVIEEAEYEEVNNAGVIEG